MFEGIRIELRIQRCVALCIFLTLFSLSSFLVTCTRQCRRASGHWQVTRKNLDRKNKLELRRNWVLVLAHRPIQRRVTLQRPLRCRLRSKRGISCRAQVNTNAHSGPPGRYRGQGEKLNFYSKQRSKAVI